MRILLLLLVAGWLQIQIDCAAEGGIQWYASWDSGLRQAQKTGRPILLIAAAPHCHNVSGIW